MPRSSWCFFKRTTLIVLATCVFVIPTYGQGRQEPGRSIGTVTTQGSLIVMTLNEGALGHANLFDLSRRTLRFTPDGTGYRAENLSLQWDSDFGSEISNAQVTLRNFTFPYSGKTWDSLSVGINGSIRFGAAQSTPVGGPVGGAGGGVSRSE